MKTFMLVFSLLFMPVISQAKSAPNDTKKENSQLSERYKVLEGRVKSKNIIVTEMFSVYCGGCYMWEQNILPELKTKLKEKNIPFEQGHVTFLGKYGAMAAKALAVAVHTNHFDALKYNMFDRLHKQRADWASDKEFFDTLNSVGISEKEFKDYENSMFVLKTLQDWGDLQKSVKAVPSFIVNNKYLVESRGLKSIDNFVELIEYLTKQP